MNGPSMPVKRILVSVELPTPEQISPLLIELLASVDVLLLGWYAVPEQTPPEQAAEELGDEAEETLQEVATSFAAAGASVDTHLVFTPDPVRTMARLAADEHCAAILALRPSYRLDRLLVPISEPVAVDRLASFIAALVGITPLEITLLGLLREAEAQDKGGEGPTRSPAADAMAAALAGAGIEDRIVRRTVVSDDPAGTISEMSKEQDLVIVADTEVEGKDQLLSRFPEELIRRCDVPVIVVREAAP